MQKLVQNIVVLGAAESGVGAAILANQNNYNVFVSDAGKIKASFRDELDAYGIQWEENGHTAARILNADVIVKSPGIPETTMIMQEIRAKKIRVVSEIEFAFPFSKGKHICITGSNGKTTTTLLIHHILKKAGFDVGLAGNIGHSYAKQVALEDHEWYVLELSSFQLDDMYAFKADIAVLTNISPDHLDRYEYKMENYVASKFRILQHMTSSDFFIYNADDLQIKQWMDSNKVAVSLAPFSATQSQDFGGYLTNEQLIINIKTTTTMSIHELALKGKHNAQNALAAGIAARLLDIRTELVRESLMDFENVEHRLEFVAKVNGVEFINDSKATNINSAWYALESMEHPTVWIVGGVDKGNDYSELEALVKAHEIGVIKMEVERSMAPENDFLKKVRQLATKHEIILIFDECTSGFRETFGGLHKKYSVEPDMAMFGKALGNGYAITAVLGKRSVMEAAQNTFISSTFWTERIGPTAALATLDVMEQTKSWEVITKMGQYITEQWNSIAKSTGIAIKTSGLPALTSFSVDSKYALEYKTLITQEMLKKSYLAGTSIYVATVHTKELVDRFINELEPVFALIKECEDGRDVRSLLDGPTCSSGFKRLN